MILKNSHIAISSAHQVDAICAPLKKIGITYFSFIRSFNDGSHIQLSNNPAWTKHYYARGFYHVVANQLPDKIGEYPLFHETADIFNITHGVVITVKSDDTTERYFFGSSCSDKKISYIYIHQTDILKKFILYFKEQAADLIEKSNTSRISVPIKTICGSADMSDFLKEIYFKKVYIRTGEKDVSLSVREATLLALMKQGSTSREIAEIINLKQKTIEIYRGELKHKLHQTSKSNLIRLANINSLIDFSLFKKSVI